MKLSNKFVAFVAMVLGVFVLSACATVASAAQTVVEVPVPLVGFIQIIVSIAATWFFTQLAKHGLDLSGYQVQVTAALVGAIVVFLNALLTNVPPTMEGLVAALLNLLVVVLSSFGVAQLVRQYRNRASHR